MLHSVAMFCFAAIQALILQGTGLQAADIGKSYAPIFGYDDKNGALFGAAAFRYVEGRPGFNQGLYGVSNGKDFHSITGDWEERAAAGVDLSGHIWAAKSFDNYYGEGDRTSNVGGLRLTQDLMELRGAALWQLQPNWTAGPTLGIKVRREYEVQRRIDGVALGGRAFPNSANPALGLRSVYDTRDTNLSSKRGILLSADLRALPQALALESGAKDAWQAQAEWRNFQPLGSRLVWAHRIAAGGSLGEPGYMERYSLGGTDQLRGFEDNRFRGKNFYLAQEELRLTLWKMISAAVSVDAGDIGDSHLDNLRTSTQAGLRIGLPPSYGMKARVDVGRGDGGESSFAVQFGETF